MSEDQSDLPSQILAPPATPLQCSPCCVLIGFVAHFIPLERSLDLVKQIGRASMTSTPLARQPDINAVRPGGEGGPPRASLVPKAEVVSKDEEVIVEDGTPI